MPQTLIKSLYTSSQRTNPQDYPSVLQLDTVLIQEQIIPIFAVPTTKREFYDELSGLLVQESPVGKHHKSNRLIMATDSKKLFPFLMRCS